MMNYHNQASISYLLKHVQENPTTDNLEALTWAMLDFKLKLRGWIELHELEIRPEVWAEYRQAHGEQASVFPLNLANRPEITEEDWEILRQMEAAWAEFGGYMKTALHGSRDPSQIAHLFVRHEAKLKEIRPAP